MTMEEILDELDNVLVEATTVPFTDKKIVEENEILHLLDELRERMPVEIVEAKRIISERQRILEDAQREAQNIIDQAKAYGARLTDDNIIVRQAQEQGNEIVALAQRSARDLQNDAVVYAEDVFRHIEGNLAKALEIVQNGKNELRQSCKK